MSFKVKLWGVRGSIPCPSPMHMSFGGNTSCVEVSLDGSRLILDAGTGIRQLGHWLLKKNVTEACILLSHTHWDHISGFPFFSPAFRPNRTFKILAGHLWDNGGIEDLMIRQFAQPTFPVPLEKMGGNLVFEDFKVGESLDLLKNTNIKTMPLNHPDGAVGYRVEFRGKSLCYVTDTEHTPGQPDENVLQLIEGADLVIYDSTYTDKEFSSKIGWGHSTWQEGIRLCKRAGAKRLVIFHHDPDHEDPFMEKVEGLARQAWEGTIVARENMRFNMC